MGAYQDIMGDLHNLFGRVNEVHLFLDPDEPAGYYVEEIIEGSTIVQVKHFDRHRQMSLGLFENPLFLVGMSARFGLTQVTSNFPSHETLRNATAQPEAQITGRQCGRRKTWLAPTRLSDRISRLSGLIGNTIVTRAYLRIRPLKAG
jgi:hypothetical protein